MRGCNRWKGSYKGRKFDAWRALAGDCPGRLRVKLLVFDNLKKGVLLGRRDKFHRAILIPPNQHDIAEHPGALRAAPELCLYPSTFHGRL